MIVVDASVIIETLLRTPTGLRAENLLFQSDHTLHTPHLMDLEVVQVLRRHVRQGHMSESNALQALNVLEAFPIARYPHLRLVPRIWELRANLTAYDATYIALAEALDATLVTCDARLKRAAGHSARVKLWS